MKDNIFRIKHNKIAPAQGRILIAEPFLRGYHFERSVILIADHDEEQATVGFVLNKKTSVYLNDHFNIIANTRQIPLYLGGPVGNNRLFFVHTLGDIVPNAQQISGDLYIGGDLDAVLTYIAKDEKLTSEVKFFLGYSGWAKGQLAKEIEENSWLVSRVHNEHIFQIHGETLWRKALSAMGKKYNIWIDYPVNPMLN
jgi:putative transcriptional regulator